MWPGHFRLVEVGGSEGTVSMADDGFLHWQFKRESPEDEAIRREHAAAIPAGGADARGASSPSSGFSVEAHQANLAEFLAAVERGEPPPIDGGEARKAVRLILAIYESAQNGGRPVTLD
jgi:predicted dehydrogenase